MRCLASVGTRAFRLDAISLRILAFALTHGRCDSRPEGLSSDDRNVVALDETGLAEARAERGRKGAYSSAEDESRNPTTAYAAAQTRTIAP